MSMQFDPRIERIALDELRPHPGNPRTHSKKQVRALAASITRFGFTNPLLVSDDLEVIAGWGRVMAAQQLKMAEVPVIRLSHLSADERRAYVLADNQLGLISGWDREQLAIELQSLIDIEFDVPVIGFDTAELDIILDTHVEVQPKASADPSDVLPELYQEVVTRPGDVWQLDRHRLVCGDARDPATYDALLGQDQVDLVFTDPPYNVAIERNVSGKGEVCHSDFAMASGEMSKAEFTQFLEVALSAAAARCRDGAIAYVCMDWRHMGELLAAGEAAFTELKNLCVWNKTQASNGTFYRSKFELVFVFKQGTGAHVNNFGLGGNGRYRTNVWDYAGANGFSSQSRNDDLAMHPTVKPVAMVKDAILDCSNRGDLVLDCFAGSGTLLTAAHKSGRTARLIEYDPRYCDVIVQRYEKLTGKLAVLEATGQTSEDVAEERMSHLEEEAGQ